MQNNWNVSAAHAYVVERTTALATQEVPVRPEWKRKPMFQKLRHRFISLFWL